MNIFWVDSRRRYQDFKAKCLLSNLVEFYEWIEEIGEESEIETFIKKGGIIILSKHLDKALNEVSETLDYNKQILILRIFERLFSICL